MGRFRGRRGEGKKEKTREWDGKREREGGAFPHFFFYNLTTENKQKKLSC